MRLVIVPIDTRISIDGESITECDVSWLPEFVGDITGVPQKVHALQWYDDHGEIELRSNDTNIKITELGIFEQAIAKHAEKKAAIEKEAAEAAAAEEESYDALFEAQQQEMSYGITDIDIDSLLANLEQKKIFEGLKSAAEQINEQQRINEQLASNITDIDIDNLLADLEQQKKNSEVIDIDKLIVNLEQQRKNSEVIDIDKLIVDLEQQRKNSEVIDIDKLIVDLEQQKKDSDSMLYGITDSGIDKVLAEIESNDYSTTSKIDIDKLLAELELEEVEYSDESDIVISKKKKKVVKEVGIATV